MLYNLLTSYSDIYSFLNFFNFLTVRTGLAVITSMMIVFLIGDKFITYFSIKKITNPIRKDGPEDHLLKNHPTMGGLGFNWVVHRSFIMVRFNEPHNWLLIYNIFIWVTRCI